MPAAAPAPDVTLGLKTGRLKTRRLFCRCRFPSLPVSAKVSFHDDGQAEGRKFVTLLSQIICHNPVGWSPSWQHRRDQVTDQVGRVQDVRLVSSLVSQGGSLPLQMAGPRSSPCRSSTAVPERPRTLPPAGKRLSSPSDLGSGTEGLLSMDFYFPCLASQIKSGKSALLYRDGLRYRLRDTLCLSVALQGPL
jgi:hypothetical protein